jgi:ionotropic glutamate receptor
MAVEDFYASHKNYRTRLVLHVRDSRGNNFQAASAGTCSMFCTMKNASH